MKKYLGCVCLHLFKIGVEQTLRTLGLLGDRFPADIAACYQQVEHEIEAFDDLQKTLGADRVKKLEASVKGQPGSQYRPDDDEMKCKQLLHP